MWHLQYTALESLWLTVGCMFTALAIVVGLWLMLRWMWIGFKIDRPYLMKAIDTYITGE